MKLIIRHICILLLIILSAAVNQGCGSIQIPVNEEINTEADSKELTSQAAENINEESTLPSGNSDQGDSVCKEDLYDKNKSFFYESANTHGIDKEEAEAYFQTVIEDNIFEDGTMELTGLIIDDIDGNGQNDMLAMVLDAAEKPFYGSGCLWIYMNNDKPYGFTEERCSFHGRFDAFWADIDNDKNTEIVFSTQGSGCGGSGDWYKAVFKYKNHSISRIELPSDLDEYYDCGLKVITCQTTEENSYNAYCPYVDEVIQFQALNVYEPSDTTTTVGSNVRGFFNLQCAEYDGQNALQVSEYLHGEGGIVHCIAIAQFLIVWDENGMPTVAEWWIEVENNSPDENSDVRIVYTDTSATAQLYG